MVVIPLTSQPRTAKEQVVSPKSYALRLYMAEGGNKAGWKCLNELWTMESHWNYKAVGSKTTQGHAYGIPQALPATKMNDIGTDWRTNYQTQIRWGLKYLRIHWHGNICKALQHEKRRGWY